jgi:outer membrane cobalamin receptor
LTRGCKWRAPYSQHRLRINREKNEPSQHGEWQQPPGNTVANYGGWDRKQYEKRNAGDSRQAQRDTDGVHHQGYDAHTTGGQEHKCRADGYRSHQNLGFGDAHLDEGAKLLYRCRARKNAPRSRREGEHPGEDSNKCQEAQEGV